MKAQVLSFLVMSRFASSERKSSARRSTRAAYRRRPEELACWVSFFSRNNFDK